MVVVAAKVAFLCIVFLIFFFYCFFCCCVSFSFTFGGFVGTSCCGFSCCCCPCFIRCNLLIGVIPILGSVNSVLFISIKIALDANAEISYLVLIKTETGHLNITCLDLVSDSVGVTNLVAIQMAEVRVVCHVNTAHNCHIQLIAVFACV